MHLPDLPLTRRTTLSGLAAITTIGLISSCSTGSESGSEEPALGGLSTDEQAAVQAQRSVILVLGAVDQATQDRPGLAGLLTPIAKMHQAHLEILNKVRDPAPQPVPSAAPLPVENRALLKALDTKEAVLVQELTRLAQKSESGKWARVLAAMSAAVQQRRLSLATMPGGRS